MEIIQFVGQQTEAERIELAALFWEEGRDVNKQARAARDMIDRLGLPVSCYVLDTDFAVYDEAKNRQCIETSKARLETALILGADVIRLDPRTSLPGKSPDEIDVDDIIARVAQGMAEVSDAAAEKGIKVGVENHGALMGSPSRIARIVQLVDRPNFGVTIDFTNFRNVLGEDHIEAARKLSKHVVHAHAKDFYISREPQEGEGWYQIPTGDYVKRAIGGEGDEKWPEWFRILKDAGYDGTISLEISDPADVKGSVVKGVANLRRIIAQVEGSGD